MGRDLKRYMGLTLLTLLVGCGGDDVASVTEADAGSATPDTSFVSNVNDVVTPPADTNATTTTDDTSSESTPESDVPESEPEVTEPEPDVTFPGHYCGDGACDIDEDCDRCPADCGECGEEPEKCGDGTCDVGEDCTSCPDDCGECPTPAPCGDGTCDFDEDCLSCETDCGTCVGDGDCCDDLNGSPGCDDAAVAECVCVIDDYCCATDWDEVCVEIAFFDCGVCGAEPSAPAYGDLVITEVMQNPDVIGDDIGEWFEVINAADQTLDLEGMTISDDGEDSHVVNSGAPILLEPGARMVFGQSVDLGVGASADYVYGSDILLGNKSDAIILSSGDTLVDSLSYDNGETFPDPVGASMRLDDGMIDADSNDVGGAWCVSVTTFGSGDLGTPGEANGSCDAECGDGACTGAETCENCTADCGACTPCGNGVCEEGEDCDNCLEDCSPCTTTPSGLSPGDFIITEIMYNPASVDDTLGEWVELMNTTNQALNLEGAVLADSGADEHIIAQSVSVEPGAYVVLALSADLGLGEAFSADYVYSGIALGNGGDSVVLRYEGVVIDEVIYDDGATFPAQKGVALNLAPGISDTAANDQADNWCAAAELMVTVGEVSEYGTPGEANTSCEASSTCGDGTCDDDETCASCEADCDPCDNCIPTDEICNGLDDDCDGSTDEGATICDDGVGCTADVCEGASGCVNALAEDYCVIGDTCYPSDGLNPANTCESCQPAVSTDAWSILDGGTCNDGDECTDNDTCSAGTCSGTYIEVPDPYELNGSKDIAYDLMQDLEVDEISDSDSWPYASLTAGMHSTEDYDWFSYQTKDTVSLSDLESKVRLTQPAGANYQLCAHYVCYEDTDLSDTTYECKDGSYLGSTSKDGHMACCADVNDEGVSVVKMRVDCPGGVFGVGSDDGGTTYVEVYRNGSADICEPYTLEWGDD